MNTRSASWLVLGSLALAACGGSVVTAPAPEKNRVDEQDAATSSSDAQTTPNSDTCEARGGQCLTTASQKYGGSCPGGDAYEVFPTAGECTPHASPNRGCCLPFDAGATAKPDAGTTCSYPPNANDPRCPAHSSGVSGCSTACATPGLTCAYPGEGDGLANGCFATAMRWCKVPLGQDAGADGGGASWVCAQ